MYGRFSKLQSDFQHSGSYIKCKGNTHKDLIFVTYQGLHTFQNNCKLNLVGPVKICKWISNLALWHKDFYNFWFLIFYFLDTLANIWTVTHFSPVDCWPKTGGVSRTLSNISDGAFAKIVNISYFCRMLHLICFTSFWIRPWNTPPNSWKTTFLVLILLNVIGFSFSAKAVATQFCSNTDGHERNQVINHVTTYEVSLKVTTSQWNFYNRVKFHAFKISNFV